MKRWLIVAAALALAAAAFVLFRQHEPATGGPPLDQIDDASRAELEQLLRKEGER